MGLGSAFVSYEVFGAPGSFPQSLVEIWSPTKDQVEVPRSPTKDQVEFCPYPFLFFPKLGFSKNRSS